MGVGFYGGNNLGNIFMKKVLIDGVEYVEKSTTKNTLTLSIAWGIRNKLLAEGNRLSDEGNKLWAEGYKFRVEGDKLLAKDGKIWAEGDRLLAEGDKLQSEGYKLQSEGNKLLAEGNKIWAESILEVFGNIKLEWKNFHNDKKSYECHLENGEVYIP